MAGLDPAIHVLAVSKKAWMPGSSPGMTTETVRGSPSGDKADEFAKTP